MSIRRVLYRTSLAITALLCLLAPAPALATGAPPKESGLLITPLRQFLNANAGHTVESSFTVANLTDKPLTVTLSVKQFSVTDYVYNYTFTTQKNDWLILGLTSVTLQPNQTQAIPYRLQIPAYTPAGGHYYTLFASAATGGSGGVTNTIQATDLVYLTVNGKLIKTSQVAGSSIQRVSFGRNIPFTLQPIDTGNVHFFIFVRGQLHGLLVKPLTPPDTHLLMPEKVRAVTGQIPAPTLPGIYRATYGYRTDSGVVVQKSSYIVYIPPWFIAFTLAALLVAGKFLPRKRLAKKTEPDTKLED